MRALLPLLIPFQRQARDHPYYPPLLTNTFEMEEEVFLLKVAVGKLRGIVNRCSYLCDELRGLLLLMQQLILMLVLPPGIPLFSNVPSRNSICYVYVPLPLLNAFPDDDDDDDDTIINNDDDAGMTIHKLWRTVSILSRTTTMAASSPSQRHHHQESVAGSWRRKRRWNHLLGSAHHRTTTMLRSCPNYPPR